MNEKDYEITDEEQSKASQQNDPFIVRFVRLKSGIWLRQDNDFFIEKELFATDCIDYNVIGYAPWSDKVDYVDFHLKRKDVVK